MTGRVTTDSGELVVGARRMPLLAGEVQFWRMPVDSWKAALAATEAAGVPIVSTYLSWRRHEPTPGRYDFDGSTDPRLDLRRFLRACHEEGLLVQLKPGPWICAEEPGGGYPDWLLAREHLLACDDGDQPVIGYNPPFRHPVPSYTDPEYLAEVRRWFEAVWDVIAPFTYPAGPVIAIQLDNEPSSCFEDAIYGTDYSPSAIAGFLAWLEATGRTGGDTLDSAPRQPPRRPSPERAPTPRGHVYDWIEYKTHYVGTYLSTLRQMHVDLGGADLLYTVNLVTHPVHDVPVSHSGMRSLVDAAIGEDHYYIPPLDTADIARLARSAATARAAGEPAPWVPELQAGIWRSPGEVVAYPDPTPLEQEIWWGAAIALGFTGMNLYMLADRENWEYSPLNARAAQSPYAAPLTRLGDVLRRNAGAFSARPRSSVLVAWHRPDAYDAYSVTGTAKEPMVAWHEPRFSAAYERWDRLLDTLTAAGILYDLWDTSTTLISEEPVTVIMASESVPFATRYQLQQAGHRVIDFRDNDDLEILGIDFPRVEIHGQRVEESLVTVRSVDDTVELHIVHWGDASSQAEISVPTLTAATFHDPESSTAVRMVDGRLRWTIRRGHTVLISTGD